MPRPRDIYVLKFGLGGKPEPLCIRASKHDAVRINRILESAEPLPRFFAWDSPRGASQVVSLADLQFLNILRSRADHLGARQCQANADDIEIHLRGQAPITTSMTDPCAVVTLLFDLETDPPELVSYWDEDGERMWLRSDQIVYLSVPRWIVRAAARQEAEDNAAAKAGAERREAVERLIREVSRPPRKKRP